MGVSRFPVNTVNELLPLTDGGAFASGKYQSFAAEAIQGAGSLQKSGPAAVPTTPGGP